jgi:hypothetical protein
LAALEQHRVLPHPVALGDPLAGADDAVATRGVKGDARLVDGEDRRLQRPDPARVSLRDLTPVDIPSA